MPHLRLFSLLLFALAGAARAGTFELSAEVSKKDLELGETFTLSLNLDVDGNFTFQPEIQAPPMDGFQQQGQPSQGVQTTWVNGALRQRVTLQVALVPVKSGRLTLGPFRATAKDPSTGELTKSSPQIVVHVKKPAFAALPPTPGFDVNQLAREQESAELRPIKPDLGFPWARAALLAGSLLALAGAGLWLALRPSRPRKAELVRDPGQVALLDLEKARQLLLAGDEEGYLKALGRILRFYLRHRLRLPDRELTLFEAQRLLERSGQEQGAAAAQRLQELLFAGLKAQARDLEQLPAELRACILALERSAHWSQADMARADLDRARERWAAGEPAAWYAAMGQALRAHLRSQEESWGGEGLRLKLDRALEELGPAAAARCRPLLLSKPLPEDADLDRLHKDLFKLIEHIHSTPKV